MLVARNTSGDVRVFGPAVIGEMTPADPEPTPAEKTDKPKKKGKPKGK